MTPAPPAPPARPAGRLPVPLLAVLVALVGLLVGLLVGGGSASAASAVSARVDACETVDLTDAAALQERARESDVVFYARLRARQADGDGAGKIESWEVRVIDKLGSRLMPSLLTVRFDTSMTPDQRILTAGADVVLFATTPIDRESTGSVLDVDLCTGVGLAPTAEGLSLAQREDLAAMLAAGPADEEPADEESVPVAFDDRDDRSLSLGRTVAPGGALVLAGLLGLMLVSWAGRQRR